MFLTPADLASFEQEANGILKVTLERFGSLRIVLPNGMAIHVMVKKLPPKKEWGCAIVVGVEEPNSPQGKKLKFGRKGFELCADGDLQPVPEERIGVLEEQIGLAAAAMGDDTPPPGGHAGGEEAKDQEQI